MLTWKINTLQLIPLGGAETESRFIQEREGRGGEVFGGAEKSLGGRGEGETAADIRPGDPPLQGPGQFIYRTK